MAALTPIRTRRGGFTLIELLVVMTIISVLVGLAMSTWQDAQRKSRATACMHNLRNIGAALAIDVADHDETFPTLVMARVSLSDPSPALDTELARYLKDTAVFACPEDYKHLAATTGTSYLWNTKLNGQRLGSLSVSFLGMDPIQDSGKIMVIGDKQGFHPYLDSKVNILYADGHSAQELIFAP